MQIQFLLGPAGSGKTFRCLSAIRQSLKASPDGPRLVLLAPKQTTFQLERELLADESIAGYTRLHICSFDRLAHLALERMQVRSPDSLSEEGRVMVLRGLLARSRLQLKVFRASARLTGFAQALSQMLGELQRNRLTPAALEQLAGQMKSSSGLALKLADLATLLAAYLEWLKTHRLQDAHALLASVTQRMVESNPGTPSSWIEHLWVDGFAEFSLQELDFLAALLPHCRRAIVTFCLDDIPVQTSSWLSHWSLIRNSFLASRTRLERVPGAQLSVELLSRNAEHSRFAASPELQHLERYWQELRPFEGRALERGARPIDTETNKAPGATVQLEWLWPGQQPSPPVQPARRTGRTRKGDAVELVPAGTRHFTSTAASTSFSSLASSSYVPQPERIQTENAIQPDREPGISGSTQGALHIASCADPLAEVTLAAREILRHVHRGGHYREVSVLVRNLGDYHEHVQRVFSRYQIPFFMDRRESIAHHPLAELTRSALRTVTLQWKHEEWFAALKCGLLAVADQQLDSLENEALAQGWRGAAWHRPLRIAEEPRSEAHDQQLRRLEQSLESLRQHLMPPFEKLALALAVCQNKPNGAQLSDALRQFWEGEGIEDTLHQWADSDPADHVAGVPGSVHATVWEQMNAWLDDLELAFAGESMPLRDWLPILEAGLAQLTVGVVPPALDQVLVGPVDRLRNPNVELVLLLGMNEGVFPATPTTSGLLTDSDCVELEKYEVFLANTTRHHLARERYLAYIACTRARQRLVLTSARQDQEGAPLNPSPFLSQLLRLFPSLVPEPVPRLLPWKESEHPVELIPQLLARGVPSCLGAATAERKESPLAAGWLSLAELPALASMLEQLKHYQRLPAEETLDRECVAKLYGSVLYTSVSRLEQFAACPFRFFVHSGLKAEERKRFELDVREQGSFQHDVLALFHHHLQQEGKRWRDLTPQQGRERVSRIAQALAGDYRGGLLHSSDASKFTARVLTEALQDFVETLIEWMRGQYRFDPVAVELPFGPDGTLPAWEIEIEPGRRLALQGRIDRVDLCRPLEGAEEALCAVIDYKSSHKALDPVLVANGLQLQLLAYLNVLRHWADPRSLFRVARLIPAGVFYVNLRGRYNRANNRLEALADTDQARKLAYRHSGRFDLRALRQLDQRSHAQQGDQFNYRLTQNGQIHRACRDPLPPEEFEALLNSIETSLKTMGRQIFAGSAEVAPYRKGLTTACDTCEYASICRIDPWTHPFRLVK